MPLRAAAVEIDITPPTLPIEKPGWIVKILADRIDDPIFAKVIVIDSGGTRIGLVSMDVLSIRWPEVERIREVGATLGIPKQNLMVAATHTHTGPAVSSPGLARRDEKYVDFMIDRVGQGLRRAVQMLAPARLAVGSAIEGRVSFIRRCIMTDGSVRTHPPAASPDIRCPESVIDPQVGLLRIDDVATNRALGVIVNFACHPTHNGGGTVLSAGWPGQLSLAIKRALGDHVVACFLNGALGDLHHQSTLIADYLDTKERVGQTLAETVLTALPSLAAIDVPPLSAASQTIQIPLRELDGPHGIAMKNRQRFAPDEVYETLIARLRAKRAKRDHVLAEVQALRIGDAVAFVALPAEPFSAIGLEIKMRSPIKNTFVVGCANGMIGYVPTLQAFDRGGYETTLSMGSKLDPTAARMLTDAALKTLHRESESSPRLVIQAG